MTKALPEAETLNQLFDYRAASGLLFWKPRPREMFTSAMQFARWNKYYAENLAGRVTRAGYRSVKIFGDGYQAHRIIWKMVTGGEPGEIDHINRDKLDNRMANLREVTRSENMKNKGLIASNTSGQRHIVWMPRLRKWTIQLTVPGKGQRQLAWCDTIEEAVEMRDRLYTELGYGK